MIAIAFAMGLGIGFIVTLTVQERIETVGAAAYFIAAFSGIGVIATILNLIAPIFKEPILKYEKISHNEEPAYHLGVVKSHRTNITYHTIHYYSSKLRRGSPELRQGKCSRDW